MLATVFQPVPRTLSSDSSCKSNKIQTDSVIINSDLYDTVDNPELKKILNVPYASVEEILQKMKYECNRLYSFKDKWPINEIKPESLAGAGLFYLQQEDRVQCPFCGIVLYNWTSADKPLREHMKKNPRCPFLIGANTGNIPLFSKQNKHKTPVSSVIHTSHSSEQSTSVDYKPKHPGMADIKRRLLTYSSWPQPFPEPKMLAESGLYYSGVADVVTCFFCGGALGNWEPNDNPWDEHTKFYPDCAFLALAAKRNGKASKSIETNPVQLMKQKRDSSVKEPSPDITTDIMHEALNIFPKPLVMDAVRRNGGNLFSLQELCDDILCSNKNQSPEPTQEVITSESVSGSTIENGSTTNSDALLCKICMDRERGVVFQPCGHLVSCWKCAQLISDCPVCRRPILHVIKTYFS